MAKRRTKTSRNSGLQPGDGSDESALGSALDRVEELVEVLELRAEQSRERVNRTQATAHARRRAEETWADLEAGRRMRHEIVAAVSIATTEVALVEAAAAAAIHAAFKQFATARGWRSGAAAKASAAARPRRSSGSAKSMAELGEMAAKAKVATACVIADGLRLSHWLAELGVQAADLRRLDNAVSGNTAQREGVLERLTACEALAAYFRQQLLAHAAVTEHLEAELRKLYQKLPEAAAEAAALFEPHEVAKRDLN